MADYSNFGKLIGKNETPEEKEKRKKIEEESRKSMNKKGFFSKLKDKLRGDS